MSIDSIIIFYRFRELILGKIVKDVIKRVNA